MTMEEKVAFLTFVAKNNRNYQTVEEMTLRKDTFIETYRIVSKHNENSSKTFTMAVNQFADLTIAERLEGSTNLQVPASPAEQQLLTEEVEMDSADKFLGASSVTIPTYVNWYEDGYVTEPQD
jgi:hypothetical protein